MKYELTREEAVTVAIVLQAKIDKLEEKINAVNDRIIADVLTEFKEELTAIFNKLN